MPDRLIGWPGQAHASSVPLRASCEPTMTGLGSPSIAEAEKAEGVVAERPVFQSATIAKSTCNTSRLDIGVSLQRENGLRM